MATTTGPLHPGAVKRPEKADESVRRDQPRSSTHTPPQHEPLSGAYFWLVVFFIVYCARPEDWIPGLRIIPIAKVSGIFAAIALVLSLGRSKRRLQDIPIEIFFLFFLTIWLFASSLLSPIWRGGAFYATLDFSKLMVTVVVMSLVVTSIARLRRLLFIQTASVIAVCAISLARGHSHLRVEGVLSGMYENPNDLAFCIALTIPLWFAFFLGKRGIVMKAAWAGVGLIMVLTLFLTGSRGGLVALAISMMVCIWHFGIQGKRPQLVLLTAVAAILLFIFAGGIVKQRFEAISGHTTDKEDVAAYESYRQRTLLMDLSWHAIGDHPLFGLGPGDFTVYSGMWREVHMAYLQVAVEGGIPAVILYILIFLRGFAHFRRLKRLNMDAETQLFAWALHGTLVGFLIGALFSPDAYQYFPFFTVTYIAVLHMTVEEQSKPALLAGAGPAPRDILPAFRKPRWLDRLNLAR